MYIQKITLLTLLSITWVTPSISATLMWEDEIGAELMDLTSNDDSTTSVVLSFDFPFNGIDYTTIFVGTNGGIQLGSLGDDDDIDYDHYSYMEEFVSDSAPSVVVNADFDLSTTGLIHFNDLGHKAVFTWAEIGTNENETALSSFQIQLFPNGSIYISLNGILDDPVEDLITDLDSGIVVGISAGNEELLTDPGPSDLTQMFSGNTEIFGRWCYDTADSCGFDGNDDGLTGGLNTDFDLDFQTITYNPELGGFAVNDVIFADSF